MMWYINFIIADPTFGPEASFGARMETCQGYALLDDILP